MILYLSNNIAALVTTPLCLRSVVGCSVSNHGAIKTAARGKKGGKLDGYPQSPLVFFAHRWFSFARLHFLIAWNRLQPVAKILRRSQSKTSFLSRKHCSAAKKSVRYNTQPLPLPLPKLFLKLFRVWYCTVNNFDKRGRGRESGRSWKQH